VSRAAAAAAAPAARQPPPELRARPPAASPPPRPPLSPAQDVIINVAPKKANWDLRRDIAEKLVKLERRTQSAMIKLMAQEEQRRAAEEEQS
jgi:coiled-coil domain-containing protein 12